MALLPNKNNIDYSIGDLAVVLNKGDFEKLVSFLNEHGGINARDEYGRTALISCIIDSAMPYGIDFAKKLAGMGADINAEDKGGYTAIYFAVQRGNFEIVDFLLTHPDINLNIRQDLIRTALSFHPRNSALIIRLIKSDHPFKDGDMTIYYDICNFQSGKVTRGDGPVDMTEVLQALHDLYPENVSHVEPFFLESVQYDFLAAYPGSLRGSDIKKITTAFSKKLISLGADIHVKDKNGHTALDFAIKNKNAEMITILERYFR